MRLLAIQHEPACPPALLGEWARERGHELVLLEAPAVTRWPQPQELDAIVSLGSDCSAHASPAPWIEREARFLADADAASVPVLGICFGAQLLARALGGEALRAPAPSASWEEIDTIDPELLPSGPWFRWHEDTFTVPPGAVELARAGDLSLGFVSGTSVALQVHPEVDEQLADEWTRAGRRQMTEQGIDLASLREQVRRAGPGARERAFDLFDRILGTRRPLC
ncbi:MAG: type 1 glutamine amidotransferase [Solirubrobacteraceae bacterium]